MNKLNDKKLDNIIGGTSEITSSLINSVTSIIKFILDIGKGVGSSFRRIAEDDLCPLK